MNNNDEPVTNGDPLLEYLKSRGVNISEPAKIDFCIYGPDQNSIQKLAEKLTGLGYEIDESESDLEEDLEEEDYMLTCSKLCAPDKADEIGLELTEIASEFNCEYDGWGTLS